jgi:hypothetical protein
MLVSFVSTLLPMTGWLQRRHIRDKMGSLHWAVGLKSPILLSSRAERGNLQFLRSKEDCGFSAQLRLHGMT